MLPPAFLLRMQTILGDSYGAFVDALCHDAVRSFRINTQKIDAARFLELCPLSKTPIAGLPDAFYTDEEKPGLTPYHHAGMLYMQDPAAMSTVHALSMGRDFKILDACAAPGGKTGQLCAVAPAGLVIANEYAASRVKILQGNLERMGYRNAVVTHLDTAVFPTLYEDYFDLVVADAPCSGEGMFRKNELAQEEWSEENISLCAARQKEILENLAPCVKAGGHLLYSTCTFAPEENEQIVSWFLQTHPDFTLCPVSELLCRRTAPGIADPDTPYDLTLCRRFYPHLAPGEGQFMALLLRTQGPTRVESKKRQKKERDPYALTPTEERVLREFLKSNLAEVPHGTLLRCGELFYLLPERPPLPARGVVAAGVAVGEIRAGRVVPHHQLFSAYGDLFVRQVSLACESDAMRAYLHGEEIAAPDGAAQGFCAVCADGVPLGGGKVVGAVVKNHYPKGLRNP